MKMVFKSYPKNSSCQIGLKVRSASPPIYAPHFKFTDRNKWGVKEWENIYHAMNIHKKTGFTVQISGKEDFKC
jgi:hypothetical protein